ncbi:MAG: MmgE/PrpD family protein, partial [Odoribacter sp.]|nr:MmgE/PrpD family protein [Odoribacter sp.]
MNKTDEFLNSIDELFRKEIPSSVIEKAKLSFLDYVGVTLAGSHFLRPKLSSYFQNGDYDSGTSTAIGIGNVFGMKDAVFLNGLNGHVLDFDDGTNLGIIHLGTPIFSVLLPLAERYEINYQKFLKAAVMGYETSFTLAASIQPMHKAMGYHATGTCGILGIAVASAYMLDFSCEKTRNAFSAACVSSPSMLQVLDNGSELKPYNVAKAALLGLVSIQLAEAGFSGNPDPLDGFRGFLKLMAGDESIELKTPFLNGSYAIEKTYTKPYAACRYCHPAIEAAIWIRNQINVNAKEIANVEIKTYDLAVKKHDHTEISSIASAKMSIPYSVAVGIICGKAGLDEFDKRHVQNNEILDLTKKVHVYSDKEFSKLFPEMTIAEVMVETVSGQKFSKRIDFPKGEPENPMSKSEFENRFI